MSASVIIYVTEVSNNVVFSGSGTLNLTDLTPVSGSWSSAAGIRKWPDTVGFRLSPSGGSLPYAHMYDGVLEPASPFTTVETFQQPDEHSGVMLGVVGTRLMVSEHYVSGSPIAASMTYHNSSFEALRLNEGKYVWEWGTAENSDSITLHVVPEPQASSLILGLAGLSLFFLRRRMPT
ncbi:hypothetical protein [Coraliomargarita akajimensis]|uniref:PEP-CTERM protein-sorting domain-containing protein n=1 Tax=Coraliomargarita akajimensis (strain DSM 45221 / IAM 15411 / JCM 23193 / KCTC 12865 / 04OKA010-24) TaxID=583355 RepID=D5ELY6_CORAD|nr:hypothetical protein [Coraliomargarita akajimensis]ADE53311.1 hypothetical protein Caka_0285 [Coraliomargarita akajimensis DSM 45221]